MRLGVRWTVLILLCSAPHALGQTTNATCVSNDTTSWLFNTNNESPCLIWARIQSLCLPPTSFVNVPPLLDPSWSYNLPSGQTGCQCDVISYALMAGCTWCQIGEGNWATEDDWKGVCGERYTTDGLGFSESVVVIPAFAWKPWDGGRWSPTEASSSASLFASVTPTGSTTLSRSFPPDPTQTQATPTPSGSSSLSATSRPSSETSSSPTSGSSDPSPGEQKSRAEKWGPIVGGIAGGIILLVLLFFLIRHYTTKNRKPPSNPVIRYKEPNFSSTGARTKSRGQSFMNIFGGYASPRGGRDRDMKRDTDLITDPMSFAAPRPAPKAPTSEHEMQCTTTTQRLRDRPVSDSDESAVGPPQNGKRLIVQNMSDHSMSSPETPPRQKTLTKKNGASPKTPGQDFSQPRPFSDAHTLPSLYEPPTGAPTFRGTTYSAMTDGSRPETLLSPVSRYPATERDSRGSTIGAALGSGRRTDGDYWSRQELPPIPRNISDDSDIIIRRS